MTDLARCERQLTSSKNFREHGLHKNTPNSSHSSVGLARGWCVVGSEPSALRFSSEASSGGKCSLRGGGSLKNAAYTNIITKFKVFHKPSTNAVACKTASAQKSK